MGPAAQRSRQQRVTPEAVAENGVEPGAEARRAGRGDRDGHERARDEHGGGGETSSPFSPEQVYERRESGVEGGLLDQHGDSGQRAGADET